MFCFQHQTPFEAAQLRQCGDRTEGEEKADAVKEGQQPARIGWEGQAEAARSAHFRCFVCRITIEFTTFYEALCARCLPHTNNNKTSALAQTVSRSHCTLATPTPPITP